MKIKYLLLSLLLFASAVAHSQRLGRFGTGGRNETGYNDIKSYFGFIDSAEAADEVRNDSACFFIYFRLADSVPDLGIRMLSPVPDLCFPNRGDFVSEDYYEKEQLKSPSFNHVLFLEQADSNDTADGAFRWKVIAFDETANGKPAPASVIRFQTPIPPGNYRITFKTQAKPSGGFMVQVGTSGRFNRLKLARTFDGSL